MSTSAGDRCTPHWSVVPNFAAPALLEVSAEMLRQRRQPVPDPNERPEAYKEADVLENLYVERGWRRKDIADHFGITDADVRRFLYRHDIEQETKNSQAPTNGLAKKLWEKGKAEAVK